MKVSFNQAGSPNIKNKNGFGYAAEQCKRSLENLGHEITWRDDTADVEINFIQPQNWYWSGVDYRIGYVPWESTEIPEEWIKPMNEVDEIWTPSEIVGEWFRDAGVTTPIRIYQHGVEPLWEAKQRDLKGRFWTLHHGLEGLRKGGEDAFRAQQKVLWEEYAGIQFKCSTDLFGFPESHRMRVIPGQVEIERLVEIYHESNLMVYPSWGEGFGLTPLQAMATGMPVLITDGWAPYAHLLGEHNLIRSEFKVPEQADLPFMFSDLDKWREVHPGKMFKPDFDDLCDKLRYQFDNRERLAKEAFELASRVHEEYNWDLLTEKAFAHLV